VLDGSSWRIVAVALLALAGCQSLPLEEQSWIEARSAHYRIVSQLDARDTQAVVAGLERFQLLLTKIAELPRSEPHLPLTVVLFRDRSGYSRFGPEHTDGVFLPGQRASYALVNGDSTLEGGAVGVLFHELTHYVLHNASDLSYPSWYDEGFAELMRGTRIAPDRIRVGGTLPDRAVALRSIRQLLPLRTILTAQPEEVALFERGAYYAQAWLFVDYLHYGFRAGMPDRSKQFGTYLELVHRGADAETACREAFGVDIDALDDEFLRFRRKNEIWGLDIVDPELLAPVDVQVRPLPAEEVAHVLGALALHARQPERAEHYFRVELRITPDAARAHLGLARALRAQRRHGEFEGLYERGLALDPDSALGQLDYARYLLSSLEDPEPFTLPQISLDQLEAARHHLRRAVELDPDLPEAHVVLARTYLQVNGQDLGPGLDAAQRARELLGSDVEALYLLALGHFRAERYDVAAAHLTTARARAHQPEPALEALHRRIEDARARPSVGTSPPD
jgi:tetratricopeptide (TPR) repeat protein